MQRFCTSFNFFAAFVCLFRPVLYSEISKNASICIKLDIQGNGEILHAFLFLSGKCVVSIATQIMKWDIGINVKYVKSEICISVIAITRKHSLPTQPKVKRKRALDYKNKDNHKQFTKRRKH
jgi:hypothetical protein